MTVRFVMVGGFLGAGKTTSLARLASRYQARGLKVGVVTNDQADNLVDTHSLRGQGLAVAEVPGACFCCRFDELVGKVGGLEADSRPDVILAEPVGSCTDLVATVIQPLKQLYAGRFSVAPYAVLFKPSHGEKILRGQKAGGFSPKAEYIFRKQLEEADAILLNRADELSVASADGLERLVADEYPGTPVLRVSAKTGLGFDAVEELLASVGGFGRKVLDIDYDTYAEGEAELGWLNCSVRLDAPTPFPLDELLLNLMAGVHAAAGQGGGEVAHLKVIGQDDAGGFGVANAVSADSPPVLSLPSGVATTTADVTVNARVAMDPGELEAVCRRVLESEARRVGALLQFRASQSLRPGRPVPTHRMAAV